jgi:hypothetical protein
MFKQCSDANEVWKAFHRHRVYDGHAAIRAPDTARDRAITGRWKQNQAERMARAD